MIDNFLRRPQGFLDVAADVVRCVAVLSVVVAAVFFEPTDAGIVGFALPGFVAPRFLGIKPGADMTFVGALFVAAWSNVLDLYTSIAWWDLLVHLAVNGMIAGGIYLLLARVKIVPDPRSAEFTRLAGILLVTMFGLAVSALWEMVEWFGREFVSDRIYTAYGDAIGDMAMGGLGSLVAGFVIAFVPLFRPDSPAQQRDLQE